MGTTAPADKATVIEPCVQKKALPLVAFSADGAHCFFRNLNMFMDRTKVTAQEHPCHRQAVIPSIREDSRAARHRIGLDTNHGTENSEG